MLYQSLALRDRGYEISFLMFNESAVFKKFRAAGFDCIVVDERQGFINLLWQSYCQLKPRKPQLFVCHGYKETFVGLWLSLTLIVAFVSTFHGGLETFDGFSRTKMHCFHLLHRGISRLFAARIVVVSQALASELGFFGLEKVEIVRNVVGANALSDNEVFSAEGKTLSNKALLKRPALIMVGRLVAIKRVGLAIRALGVLHNLGAGKWSAVQLYVVGDGPEREALENLASDIGVEKSVHFLGFRTDILELLGSADLLLLLSEKEGIPTVVLEAISQGLAVISTELPGVREVVNELGEYPVAFLQTEEPDDIAKAVAKCLEISTSRDQSRESGQEALKRHFSPIIAAKKLEAIFNEVLS